MPSPDNPFSPAGNPVLWFNHVVAQAALASAGSIPRNAVAFGVSVDRDEVTLHCQLIDDTRAEQDDLQRIAEDLDIALELQTAINSETHVSSVPVTDQDDRIAWLFVAREPRPDIDD